jgi:hypothetical protein
MRSTEGSEGDRVVEGRANIRNKIASVKSALFRGGVRLVEKCERERGQTIEWARKFTSRFSSACVSFSDLCNTCARFFTDPVLRKRLVSPVLAPPEDENGRTLVQPSRTPPLQPVLAESSRGHPNNAVGRSPVLGRRSHRDLQNELISTLLASEGGNGRTVAENNRISRLDERVMQCRMPCKNVNLAIRTRRSRRERRSMVRPLAVCSSRRCGRVGVRGRTGLLIRCLARRL